MTVYVPVNDPAKVGRCLPEVIDVTVRDATHFDAVVRVGVGPVRGKFTFKFQGLDQRLTGVEQSNVIKELIT